MGRTPLTGGKLLSIEESIERLAAFRASHPTRYVGVLWRGTGQFAVTRSVFAAPAASDADLLDAFRNTHAAANAWAYATTILLGTDSLVAHAWLNER